MALTATANPRVRLDVTKQLGLTNCKWYLCSFNRPNLKYIVHPKKGSSTINEIIELIKKKFHRSSGIIYCLSRKDCDSVAQQIKSANIRAASYHAGMSDDVREQVQKEWITDRVQIICATIAFGMGIDKPDVRFVFHYCLPKSIEGFYQEAGRAGRDGEIATCILYYSYSDVQRYKKMTDKDSAPYEAKQVHLQNLNRIVAYCENVTDCRRQQQLEYFAEHFSRDQCLQNRATACDNCLKQDDYKKIDATEDCMAIARCIKDLCSGNNRFTVLHIVDVLKGSSIKKIMDNRHNQHSSYARLKTWDKSDINRLLHKMVMDHYLKEEMIFTNDIPQPYIRIGPRIEELMKRNVKFEFHIREKTTIQQEDVMSNDTNNPLMNEELKELTQRCYDELVKYCQEIANEKHIQLGSVMNLEALHKMSKILPTSQKEMLKIQHVTKANFDKYGAKLLDITSAFEAEKICKYPQCSTPNYLS